MSGVREEFRFVNIGKKCRSVCLSPSNSSHSFEARKQKIGMNNSHIYGTKYTNQFFYILPSAGDI